MDLLRRVPASQSATELMDNDIRLDAIGDLDRLPARVRRAC